MCPYGFLPPTVAYFFIMVGPFVGAKSSLRVLVVDDEFINRNLLQRLLSSVALVEAAANGSEAVAAFTAALAEHNPYHLVCLDIMMPGMDGTEVLRQIRSLEESHGLALSEGTKVLMISALNDPKTIMGSFREHCDGYLVKPFAHKDLGAELVRLGLV